AFFLALSPLSICARMWRTSKYSGGAAIAATDDAVGVVEATGVGVEVAREVMTNLAWQKDDVDYGGKVFYISSYASPYPRKNVEPRGPGPGQHGRVSVRRRLAFRRSVATLRRRTSRSFR